MTHLNIQNVKLKFAFLFTKLSFDHLITITKITTYYYIVRIYIIDLIQWLASPIVIGTDRLIGVII